MATGAICFSSIGNETSLSTHISCPHDAPPHVTQQQQHLDRKRKRDSRYEDQVVGHKFTIVYDRLSPSERSCKRKNIYDII